MTAAHPAEVDVVVVGAGVVGLAVAAALATQGREVVVLERHDRIAHETSSRNSQVIHAGLYYPEGSLKAELCALGRELVYERCARHGIPHRQTGKLIVATGAEELPALEALAERARRAGVPGIEWLDAEATRRLEPAVRAVASVRSPRSGILDAHELCSSFLAEAESAGAVLVLRSALVAATRRAEGYELEARGGDGAISSIRSAAVVNAAGLASDRVAALPGLDVDGAGLRLHPCKGDYFAIAPGAPIRVNGLVYPAPASGGAGLGIHVTCDLGGRLRLGPDATYVERPDYAVDEAKAAAFAAAASRYLPALQGEWLTPDGAGVRPKLAGPGEAFRDFAVREESAAGLPGWVNLVGIESPGLTAAPALARRVAALLRSL